MTGKPFSIQAPQDIAKEYGGNKQKIAQAVQTGLLDPTSAVLAGMFIDRMRSAQMMEQAQAPTIAQQVMTPRPPVGPSVMPPGAPAGGLGAMAPQGAPPMAPPMAPQGPGMADGGFIPPYASGGLDGLPVPDTMFDESRNGGFDDGYAGGGIVAFAAGDSVDQAPSALWSQYNPMFQSGMQQYDQYLPQQSRESLGLLTSEARSALDPTGQARQKKQDKWMALAQIGANLAASNSPYFFQALGSAAAAALPGIKEDQKAREAKRREAIRDLASAEDITRKEAENRVNFAQNYATTRLGFTDKDLERLSKEKLTREEITSRENVARIDAGSRENAARISAKGYTDYQDKELLKMRIDARRESTKEANAALKGNPIYTKLQLSRNPADQAKADKMRRDTQASLYNQMTGEQMSYDKNGRMIINVGGQWVYPE